MHLTAAEFARLAAEPHGREELSAATGTPAVVVEFDAHADTTSLVPALDLPCVVVGVVRGVPPAHDVTACVDVLLAEDPAAPGAVAPPTGLDDGLQLLLDGIDACPIGAAALAMLLRGAADRSIAGGLASESLVYSLVQAGPEFRGRLASLRRPARNGEEQSTVAVRREADELLITLSRPHVHNAFNVAMRDELVEALTLALVDPTIRAVVLSGEGPSFCSGGDLSEFGTTDPATAHIVRMTRSVGRLMALLRERLQVRLHGACIGAGIELAAFAGRVTATHDAHFALPELSFGLIPGAGGTVSIPARVGRQRTAWLALSGARLDAATALQWGLVDELVPQGVRPGR